MRPQKPEPMSLIITILERGKGNKAAKLFTQNQVFMHHHCVGEGTASSEIMDVLGLTTPEKDILISVSTSAAANHLLDLLEDELHGAVGGTGIVFTIPITAIGNLLNSAILANTNSDIEQGEPPMNKTEKTSLILVSVNQGFTDAIMETARAKGARGGTVLRARWSDSEHLEHFYGITVHAEKEIVAIVATNDRRNAIMDAINEKHGLKTKAHGTILSVGINRVAHLS